MSAGQAHIVRRAANVLSHPRKQIIQKCTESLNIPSSASSTYLTKIFENEVSEVMTTDQYRFRAANLMTCHCVRHTKKMSGMEVSRRETRLWKCDKQKHKVDAGIMSHLS